ncbi:MAG: TetR/AcrR family transcriptional regulator, partial [Clostridia bacterium]|nr:TetR/AcrR family transcriptional regulator [Clostridia bacterium]
MPPKVKITKEEIVEAAMRIVRECGDEALNARNIAASLGCSTQPVFSNFATMAELRLAVIKKA